MTQQYEGPKLLQSSLPMSSPTQPSLLTSLPMLPFLSSSSLSSSTSPSSSSSSSSSLVSTSNDFRLSYSKLSVSNGSHLRILYDSKSSSLRLNNISTITNNNDDDEPGRLSLSQQMSQSQSNTQISDSDTSNLSQMIDNSSFFQLDATYPPSINSPKDSYNTVYVLTIEIEDSLHTVIWTDNSDFPESLMSIVKTIEKIYSS